MLLKNTRLEENRQSTIIRSASHEEDSMRNRSDSPVTPSPMNISEDDTVMTVEIDGVMRTFQRRKVKGITTSVPAPKAEPAPKTESPTPTRIIPLVPRKLS